MIARAAGDRLRDIQEAATDLIDFAASFDEPGFHALQHVDRMAYRAIKNALSEMGEALKTLPPEIPARHPQVDWKGFAGLRDIIAHQYFGVDTTRLLAIIRDEVPGLLAAIESELQRPTPSRDPA